MRRVAASVQMNKPSTPCSATMPRLPPADWRSHRVGIDQPIVSQQLARLRASGIVVARKSGTATRYVVTDPLLKDLLRTAKQILNRRLVGVRSLLRELERD